MGATKINIQDQFLNQSRKKRVKVILTMITGEDMEGYIKSFDNFSVVLENDKLVLIYKHGIVKVTPVENISLFNF